MSVAVRRLWHWIAFTQSQYRRHAALTSITSFALYGSGVVTGPLLARALGPEGRGDFAAVMAPMAVVAWLLAFGLPTACAFYSDRIPETRVLSSVTAFGVVVGVPACAVLWYLAPRYLSGHSPTTVTWARAYLLTMPLTVGMSAALEVRRRRSPDAGWNLWRAAPLIVPAIGIILLAVIGRLTLTSALAVALTGSVIPLFLLFSRLRPVRRAFRPEIATLRIIFPYALRAGVAAATTSVTSRLDQVVLVAIVAPEQLGLYAVAVTVASVTSPLTSGLALALFGHLRPEEGPGRATARFRRTALVTALVSSTVATGLAISAPLLLRVGFGGRFEDAAAPLRLLLPGAVALDVLVVLGTKLYSDGRPGEASRAGALGAGITLIGLPALAPRFGIAGAAVVTSCAFVVELAFLVCRGALRAGPTQDGPDPHRSPRSRENRV